MINVIEHSLLKLSSNSIHISLTLGTILPVVDSLKPTEIVVSFSAICHWNDAVPSLPSKEETKPPSKTSVIPPEHTSGTEQTAQGNISLFVHSVTMLSGHLQKLAQGQTRTCDYHAIA